MQYVNWYQAIAFCNKLSIAEGLTPAYSVSGVDFSTLTFSDIPTSSSDSTVLATWNAASVNFCATGYRLPTEMEWMWAAMGAPADGQGGGTNTTGYAKAFAGSTGSNAIGLDSQRVGLDSNSSAAFFERIRSIEGERDTSLLRFY